ncbi:hypothetical protein PsorP6_008004 [Peronosclerospora sorghi]|uniref:Uncharacterized protein n=1 Tax=Peronosclerospora sorghi TaxID=230839 RepID=A0ACC0WAG6_9STRA|nr:hypothetical protein PsorP6_008004 [Peronosclerospora sorghi]
MATNYCVEPQHRSIEQYFSRCSVVMTGTGANFARFNNLSTTSKIVSYPSHSGSPVITYLHASGMGIGTINPFLH